MSRVLDIAGLVAGYDKVPVVRDLNMHIDEGEVVAMLGPNGAGKTTTLMTISGMVEILDGSVNVFGEPVPKLRKAHYLAQQGLTHVPENRGIMFQLTVADNLQLAKLKGTVDVSRAIEYFPALEPLLSRRAGLLSGGEQQMLALGRAVLSDPKLLMIDELSLGLAPIIYEELLPIVRRFADETGASVLLVEQHADLALAQADRAYVLSHGDLVMEGTAAELLKNRHLLDATYLGVTELEEE